MQVLIISATALEINALREKVQQEDIPHQVSFLITGPGLLAAAFSITKAFTEQQPDLALQAGLAGTYSPSFPPGSVAAIATEEVFDCGVTEGGQFKNLFDLNLAAADEAPFQGGLLRNPDISRWEAAGLQAVRGITVNEITTRAATIQRVQQTGMPALESMEGAALHYAALQFSVPFLQLRAVSNEIGERDKSKWSFGPALENLHKTILHLLTNQQL